MNRIFGIMTFLAAVSFGAACQNAASPVSNTAKLEPNTAVNNTAVNKSNDAQPEPENLKSAAKKITFKSADGLQIVGSFYASAKPNSPAVLMLHQWGSNRASYDDLAKQFQAGGIGVLTIDGRGFGESVNLADNSKVSAGNNDKAVSAMNADVTEAVKFLAEQTNVDKNRIGIIGASYGSSLAIIHAADDANTKAIALLSPGLNYFGTLPTEPAIKTYGARPVLLVAAEDDSESADAVRRLDSLAAGDKHKAQIYPKGGHGTGILSAKVGLDKLLLEFFNAQL